MSKQVFNSCLATTGATTSTSCEYVLRKKAEWTLSLTSAMCGELVWLGKSRSWEPFCSPSMT